ncbi:DUF4173 domain-containing protein [Novosphingobium sp.]|uniref:DUF4153 domain-containing protein n=1 Tax=Novosphingobium sp. TaxID=1874826 RepID=UPI00286D4D1A|nr:DUF4173 domain-containing protein [Novosphingobium sp.]
MQMLATRRWDGSLLLKIALAAGLVALGDTVFWRWEQVGGVQGLFGLGLCLALLAGRPAVRRDRRALVALGAAVLFACALVWNPGALAFVLFWIAIGMATLLPATARFDDGWRWFQRLWAHGFKALFGPLIDLTVLGKVRRKRPTGQMGLRRVIPLLALPLAGGALFVTLFAQANPVIAALLAALSLPAFDWDLLPRMITWGVFALFAWGVLRPRPPRRLLGTLDATGDVTLPGFSLASITLSLAVFNALFAVQNLMDMAYLSGAAALPQGITLADYAHRGAYPLVATALLAALFVLVSSRPGSSTAASPLVRWLVAVWIAQNVVLVFSAAWRTWDYVQAYSLTTLRISALLWMALVAVGLVLVLVRMLHAKPLSWLINANLASAGLLLSVVSFVDLGAVSASWNVRHAREIDGDGAQLDLCYLQRLGPAALPALDHLAQHQPSWPAVSGLRAQAQARSESDIKYHWWTLAGQLRLGRSLALGKATYPDTFGVGCNANDLRD